MTLAKDEPSDEDQGEDVLISLLSSSGFKIVPLQAIIDALAEMEDYIKKQTGLNQEDLDQMLEKIEELVGKQEAMELGLDEIVGWIRAIRGF